MKKDWEKLLEDATNALREAHTAMHDVADWSGSSGNWYLHEKMSKVDEALLLLEPKTIND